MRRLIVSLLLLLGLPATIGWAQQTGAGEQPGQVLDLVGGDILDLTYRAENLGGNIQSLQLKETATETRIELPADILFDFDKDDIRPSAAEALKQVAAILRERAKGTILIEGHTDSKGSHAYNLRLSDRRAASVQRWLLDREGLRQLKFATKGLAETRPVAPNAKPDGSDDPDGRQKNRRVEIVFGRR